MKFTASAEVDLGRAVCVDDPETWVYIANGDSYLGRRTLLYLALDGELFCFVNGPSEGDKPTSLADMRYTIHSALETRVRKVIFASGNPKTRELRPTATRFTSRDQQERAIEALNGAVAALGPSHEFYFSQIRFTEAIWRKFDNGDYIAD